jgi:hypothetical protein
MANTILWMRLLIDSNTSRAYEEGAHSPSWPNGLINIIIVYLLIPGMIMRY